jgi:hypothetical protein
VIAYEESIVLRELGDGLVLRRATPADAERLAALHTEIFTDDETHQPDPTVAPWTRDSMSGRHPTLRAGDFTLVEDTRNDRLVSSMNLISQRWSYGGVEFGVGRPEAVCTLPEYRNRGLVRAQFDVVHQWSAERGELVQAITGIPYYYRQFGYEMAMDLGTSRAGFWTQIPALKDGESEPYRLRPAGEADLAFVAEMAGYAAQRSLVTCLRDEALWRYIVLETSPLSGERAELDIIETPEGRRVGCVAHPLMLWEGHLTIQLWELVPGVPWHAVVPTVMRHLKLSGERSAAMLGKRCERYGLSLGAQHPVYEAMRSWLPIERNFYAWYLRVPDLPGFLRHIAPVLERRLAASPAAGFSGELRISFYREGVRLAFENGRLVSCERGQVKPGSGDGMAGFPGLTFLQLLFGYRSLAEVRYAFADCWVDGDGPRLLLEALFPKQPSSVWPVG